MEQYILKLSDCQQREDCLREKRDCIIRKHEKELEQLDDSLASISRLRNQIIEDFKQFLDGNQIANSNVLFDSPQLSPSELKKTFCENGSLDSAFQSNFCESGGGDGSGVVKECQMEIESQSSPTKPKSNRAFRLVQRLKTSKSTGSLPNQSCLQSPTTSQIESMLNKVRDGAHSLDNSTINQCIDLLSSRIIQDKDILKIELEPPTADITDETKLNEKSIGNKELLTDTNRSIDRAPCETNYLSIFICS